MIEVAQATVTIIPNMKGAQSKISSDLTNAGATAGKGAGGLFAGKFIGVLAGFKIGEKIAGALKDGIKATLQEGADLEQSLGGVETLFKKSANQVKANAAKAFETTGMSANQYMENVTSFSASLISSLGGDTNKAASYADRALKDMSDNANKMGTDMEMITGTYQSLARGNFNMLDNLKLGYGGTKAEMQRLISDTAQMTEAQDRLGISVEEGDMSFGNMVNAISLMQDKLGIAGATADEAATTYSGSLNAMKAASKDFMGNLATGGDVGGAISNLANTAKTFFVDNAIPMMGNIIVGLGKAIITGIPKLMAYITSGINGLITKISNINFAEVATNIIQKITDALTGEGPKVAGTGLSIITNFTTALIKLGPKLIVAALKLMGNLVVGIIKAIPKIIKAVPKMIKAFIDELKSGEFSSAGTRMIASLASGIWGAASKVFTKVKNIVIGITTRFEAIKSKVSRIFMAVKSAITNPIDTAKKLIQKAINKIKSIFDKLKLKLPTFKLPHFDIKGGKAPWGIAGKGTAPKISVKWYAKAATEGAEFSSPTIIGVGDAADTEVLLGKKTLLNMVNEGKKGGNVFNINMRVDGAESPEKWAARFTTELKRQVRMGV